MAGARWVDAKTLCGEGWNDWPTRPGKPVAIEITAEDDALSFDDAPTADYVPYDGDDDPETTAVDAVPPLAP